MRISTPTPYNSGYAPLKRRIAANRYMKFAAIKNKMRWPYEI